MDRGNNKGRGRASWPGMRGERGLRQRNPNRRGRTAATWPSSVDRPPPERCRLLPILISIKEADYPVPFVNWKALDFSTGPLRAEKSLPGHPLDVVCDCGVVTI